MKTYEDLLRVAEYTKGEFCAAAVREFEGTHQYRDALDAVRYYQKHNVTIETYEKWLYTITGRKVKDNYSANHKLKTHQFRRQVIQEVNYLLGNGVQLSDPAQKDKLGKKFDHNVLELAKYAMVEGRSYGFWNVDHLEVFAMTCTVDHAGFCELKSKKTGELKAGIQFYYEFVDGKRIGFYILYEPEGVTKFIKRTGETAELLEERKAYKLTTITTPSEGIIDTIASGYGGTLPIVTMYSSDTHESEFVGMRESIDCYDLIKSGLADNIDDASEIYWLVKNAGGMEDTDLAKFLQRVKRSHIAQVDSIQGEGAAEPHTISVPTDARKAMLEILRTDMYDDMMLLDRRSMSAAQKTEQELDMAYQPQDDKVNDLEFYVMDFLDQIYELAGLPSDINTILIRNKVVNVSERSTMVLAWGNYLSAETMIKHCPFLTPEEAEEEVKVYQNEQVARFTAPEEPEEEEPEEIPEEVE